MTAHYCGFIFETVIVMAVIAHRVAIIVCGRHCRTPFCRFFYVTLLLD